MSTDNQQQQGGLIDPEDILGRPNPRTIAAAAASRAVGTEVRTDGLYKDMQGSLKNVLNPDIFIKEARELTVKVNGVTLTRMPEHELFRIHRDMMPKTWRAVNPKVYKGADRWHDARYVSCAAASAFGYMMMNKIGDSADRQTNDTIAAERAMIAHEMVQHRMPLFFVDRELAQSAWMTDPPDKVDWATMKLPYEAAAFVLPKGLLKSPHGFDLPFIMFGRVPGDEPMMIEDPDTRKVRELTAERDCFLISSMCTEIHVDYFRELVAPYEPTREWEYKAGLLNWYAEAHEADGSIELPTTESDVEFNTKMCNFVFNLLLLMQEKHEAVQVERSRPAGRHKRTRTELWTPNVIGDGYRIRRVGPGSTGGDHGTKRWHWRRGHWREQGYGPLVCQSCTVKGHGPAWHDRETKICRHNDCMDTCRGADYVHESHYRKWIQTMLVGAGEGKDGKAQA
jgi:hypothetical protein